MCLIYTNAAKAAARQNIYGVSTIAAFCGSVPIPTATAIFTVTAPTIDAMAKIIIETNIFVRSLSLKNSRAATKNQTIPATAVTDGAMT